LGKFASVAEPGLGGRDLSYPIPWDISIRTDKEGQAVYGPLEETVVVPGILGGTETLQVSALGRSKAPMNFWCSTTLPWTVPSIGKPS